MALTVCRHCGKKVSDTIETCIHCGGLIAEPPCKPQEPPQPEPVEPTVYDYFIFSDEKRLKLEKTFLENDMWAYKYRHTGVELSKFKSLFGSVILWLWIAALAATALFALVYNFEVQNMNLVYAALIGAAILFVASLIMVIVLSILQANHKGSHDKFIYLKKYQKWLRENHNISFNPKFEKKKDQEKFNSINGDNITY